MHPTAGRHELQKKYRELETVERQRGVMEGLQDGVLRKLEALEIRARGQSEEVPQRGREGHADVGADALTF